MKFLLVLTIVASIVAAAFAYMNRNTFVGIRNEKDSVNKKIQTEKAALETLVDDTTIMIEERKKIEGERDIEKEKLDSAERNLAKLKSNLSSEQSKLSAQQNQYTEYEKEFDKLPPGVSPDSLKEDTARLEQTLADKEAELASLEKEIAIMNDNLARNTRTLGGHKERQSERTENFNVNSLEAIVTAVNQEWGFVIVNAGADRGIRPDSSLLVVRGDRPVGKLRIISLEAGRLIADIDQDASLGIQVLPGDIVQLETPNNG